MTKLLMVDDSALMRKLLAQVFSAEPDFEVRFARNGVEALEFLKSFEPDVITLDVHMPQMDGLTCLDRIMIEHPCPVVMLSSLTSEGADATLEAFRLGAVDFVAKPSGALSLRLDEFIPELRRKVRSAIGAKLSTSLRLRERVRHRIGRPASSINHQTGRRTGNQIASGLQNKEGLVLIGTSTGGPPALEEVLTTLPAAFPWPVVVAQHMPASFTGALAKRLDQLCAVSITEVAQPTSLQPGCVYIGRGDADIVVSRKTTGLVAMSVPSRTDYLWHPSVDRLVRSAMEHIAPSQLVGVLMTGMGNDGAEAMALLRSQGGRTIAESEESAVVWGMPGELVKMGGANWVLPLSSISGHLERLLPSHATDPQNA